MKQTLTTLAVAALFVALAPGAGAQSDQSITVPLSDPGRPVTLKVSVFNGSISIRVHDADEIVVGTSTSTDEEPAGVGRGGLRRIPNTSMGLTVEERDNAVVITVDHLSNDIRLDIAVPRDTSVSASAGHGGDLIVEGVAGEHEFTNLNGDISATDIAGSAVVNTTNGDVQISFTELTPDKAMSFTTFNGDVEVTFPESLAADLRIDSARGDVLTDFDFVVQPQSPVIERSENGGRNRVRLARETRAIVGGGGPEMYFKTFNGDIIIRHR